MCSFLFVLATLFTGPCSAQSPPQAIVLVQSSGDTTLAVITYAGRERHEQVRHTVQDIARVASAQVLRLAISDVPLDERSVRSRQQSSVQTSAEVWFRGAAFVLADAFFLQPFVEALKGLGRFDILFVTPPARSFTGLTHFSRNGVEVRLVQAGNPYRYAVSIERGVTNVPILPLRQPEGGRASPRHVVPQSGQTSVLWVVLAAIATAFVVFVALRTLGLRRAG